MRCQTRFEGIDTFMDFLADLSVDDWLAVGARNSRPPISTVSALEATLSDQRLHVDAWLARDEVETLVFLATCSLSRARRAYRAINSARAAAERAALAIIASPWLAPSDVDELLLPFSDRRLAARRRAA